MHPLRPLLYRCMSLIDSLGLELASSLLIKDSLDAPGNFLLPQLLRAALKEGYMVSCVQFSLVRINKYGTPVP